MKKFQKKERELISLFDQPLNVIIKMCVDFLWKAMQYIAKRYPRYSVNPLDPLELRNCSLTCFKTKTEFFS